MFKSIKRKFSSAAKPGFVLNKSPESVFTKGAGVEIIDANILLEGRSTLIIHDNAKLESYDIHITDGSLEIGSYSHLIKGRQALNPIISVNNGKLVIGAYNVIKADIKLRFGGICTIGTYNCINEETEIRCDHSVTIGDYNMISYQCMIYDTNTHCSYPPEIRRERSKADFPFLGTETEKPITKEVVIGNDNWIGKRAVILKGCRFGNEVTVGTNAVVSNIQVDKGLIVGNPARVVDKK